MARKSRKNASPASIPQAEPRKEYNVGAYVRLSAVDRKQKGDSIETQQAIIRAFIAERPGLVLRVTYIDNGTTGTTFERPAFQRMLADAENGKINCIATKDLSRLGRNAIDTGFYIEKYFPTRGLRFIAINDDYDSADGQSGGLMVSLKNIVNESYALEVGRKVRATKQMNIRAGAFVGRIPPYGYLKSAEDNHKLTPDADTVPIVRQMYEMAASGSLVSAIVKRLNDSEVLPPRRYFQKIGLATAKDPSGHIHWNKGVVYSILHNQVYCGDMVQGKHRNIDHVEVKLPQSEWVVTENTHEPIVSRKLWEQVQRLWPGKRETVPYSENIFLRKIFCGHCGYTMRRTRNSKKAYSFTCVTRQIYGEADCVQVSISENDLKEQLLVKLRAKLEMFAERQAKTALPAVEADNAKLRGIRMELEKKRGFLKSLYEHLALNDITADEYREMKQGYEGKIAELSEQERLLRERAIDRAMREAEAQKASGGLGAVHTIRDLTAEVLDAFVERIDVFEGGRIKVTYRFMDETRVGTEDEQDA